MIDPDTEALLATVREKIARAEAFRRAGKHAEADAAEPTEDEMREVVIAARSGRRSAAEGQKRARAKPPTLSVTTLFQR